MPKKDLGLRYIRRVGLELQSMQSPRKYIWNRQDPKISQLSLVKNQRCRGCFETLAA